LEGLQGELEKESLKATKRNAQRIWSKLVESENLRNTDPFDRERTPWIWRITPWDHTDIKVPGTRVSLNALAKATLGAGKLGKSQDAPALFDSGKLDELINYCEIDVLLTLAVFMFGCTYGAVNIKDLTIPVRWGYLAQQLAARKRKKGPTMEAKCLEYQMKITANHPLLPIETSLNEWRSSYARGKEVK
jgi:hypothetical protein